MWNNLSTREKRLLGLLAVLLVCVGLYWFVFKPQWQACSRLRSELELARKQLKAARNTCAALDRETKALHKAEAELADLRAFFYTDLQDGGTVFDFGLKALEKNVVITKFKPFAVIDRETHLVLPIELGVRGAYPAVAAYLDLLEHLFCLSEIRFLDIEAEKEDALPTGDVQAEALLLLYSEPSPEGRLMLEEMSRWDVGRFNAFARPASTAALLPGKTAPRNNYRSGNASGVSEPDFGYVK
ncbi:MAG: type II secretion system protein M [Peptococcaceae bacterium]|nr:type II secretion system protein M [Peptococcaceae bacterium]